MMAKLRCLQVCRPAAAFGLLPHVVGLLLGCLVLALPLQAAAKDNTESGVEEPAPPVGEGVPTRTLAERVPSVSRRTFSKASRFELYPELGMSLTDPFYRYVTPGLGINYYVLETLAVGLTAEYYGAVSTPIIITGGALNIASPTFNRPAYDARLQVSWLPLYGKISWLAEGVLHFDTYLTGSVGYMGAKAGGSSILGSLALGQHYFLNDWLAIRLELRNEVYNLERTAGTGKQLQSLLSASAGLSFYLPQRAESGD